MTAVATEPRLLRLPANVLPALYAALAHELSGTVSATLLRRVGYEAGEAMWNAFERWSAERARPESDPRSLPADEFWSALSDFLTDSGWGSLRQAELHPGVAALDADAWAEAEAADERSHPGCQFTTGMIAELLRRAAGAELAVLEVECAGRGDARCRFLVGSPVTLEALYARIRDGSSYSAALETLE